MKLGAKILIKLESKVLLPYYPVLLGGVALVDNFIFLVPIAVVLATSVIACPKRWFQLALWTTIGSAIGAILFAYVIAHYGTSILETFSPHLMTHKSWHFAERLIGRYGIGAVWFCCTLPVTEHAMIALAMLAKLPLAQVSLAILGGKIIKFFILSWVASHAPQTLLRFKWFRNDVDAVKKEIHATEIK